MKGFKKILLFAGVLSLAGGGLALSSSFNNKAPGADAAAGTYSVTPFTTVSGDIGKSGYSYESQKANAGTAPVINDGDIRLYQNGSNFIVSAATGTTDLLKSITLTRSTNTDGKGPFKWVSGADSTSAEAATATSVDVKSTEWVNNVWTCNFTEKTSYFKLTTTGTTKKTRVYLSGLSIETLAGKTLTDLVAGGTLTKTTYNEGDTFSTEGLTITASYDDATNEDVTSLVTWDPTPLTAGTTSVTGSFAYCGVTKTVVITGITVNDRNITSVVLEANPSKTAYFVGETFALTGMKVTAKWNVGQDTDVTSLVTSSIASNYVFLDSDAGTKSVTITYETFPTMSFDINVSFMTPSDLHQELASFKDKSVRLTGTVTDIIEDYSPKKSFFVQSGASAVLVYKVNSTDITNLTVGSKVTFTGKVTVYSELVELTGVTNIVIEANGEAITPYEIVEANYNKTALTGMDSRLVTLNGLNYVSGSIYDASTKKQTNVSLNLGATSVTARVQNATHAANIYVAIDEFFAKLGTQGKFTFTGILGWFNGPQLSPTSIGNFTSADVDAVDALVALLHMGENVEGQCNTLFAPANESYKALTVEQKAMFDSNTGYKAAKDRYDAWAKVAVVEPNVPSILDIGDEANTIFLVTAAAIVTTLVASVVIISRLKKKEA